MKILKGRLIIYTSDNIKEITNILKNICLYISVYFALLIFVSAIFSLIFVKLENKRIENEISFFEKQNENILLQHRYIKSEIANIKKNEKEKTNLKLIIQKINPNLDKKEVNLWADMILENRKFIEGSLNLWSKIKFSFTETPHSLNPSTSIILAIAAIESNFNTNIMSHKGAIGGFQLISNTANELGLENPLNPVENIIGGIKYLEYLLNIFGKNQDQIHLTIASYNAGPSRMIREWMLTWGDSWNDIYYGLWSINRFTETREYSILTYELMTLFASGNWINKSEDFWNNYKNNILSKDNFASIIFF